MKSMHRFRPGHLCLSLVAATLNFVCQAAPGDVDATFDLKLSPFVNVPGFSVSTVRHPAVQKDGKIIIVGDFTSILSTARTNIARVNPNGTLDSAFAPTINPGEPRRATIQTDGKVLISGFFSGVNGIARTNLARLNTNGTLDTAFNPVFRMVHPSYESVGVGALDGGRILVGGNFTNVNGVARSQLARLNSDGTLDTSFSASIGGSVGCMAVQLDGKYVIGGSFTNVGGLTRRYLARLNSDGSVDSTFNPNPNSGVWCVAVQADGKILAGGSFGVIGGFVRTALARLQTTGSLDSTFNAGLEGDPYAPYYGASDTNVANIALQADGKMLIAGQFVSGSGVTQPWVARLNTNGTMDTTFRLFTDGVIDNVHLQADGRIFVAGSFQSLNGRPRVMFARLENDVATQTLRLAKATRLEWLRGGSAPEAQDVAFEYSLDGGAVWSGLGLLPPARIAGGWELTSIQLQTSALIRARARVVAGDPNSMLETTNAVALIPEISVSQPPGSNVSDNASRSFGYMLVGSSSNLTFTIQNIGSSNLAGIAITKDGANPSEYVVITNPVATVSPDGGTTTFTVQFSPLGAGSRTAALHIANNDPNENPFDINLSGYALVSTADDDGDGLANADELNLTSFGFHPLVDNSPLLTQFRANGLYLPTDLQTLALNAPVIERDPANGHFALRLSLDQSPDLSSNSWMRLTGFTVSNDPPSGVMTLDITPTNSSPRFYRLLGAKP